MRELGTDKSLQFLLSKKRFKTKFFFRNERAFQCFLPVAPVPKKKKLDPEELSFSPKPVSLYPELGGEY